MFNTFTIIIVIIIDITFDIPVKLIMNTNMFTKGFPARLGNISGGQPATFQQSIEGRFVVQIISEVLHNSSQLSAMVRSRWSKSVML